MALPTLIIAIGSAARGVFAAGRSVLRGGGRVRSGQIARAAGPRSPQAYSEIGVLAKGRTSGLGMAPRQGLPSLRDQFRGNGEIAGGIVGDVGGEASLAVRERLEQRAHDIQPEVLEALQEAMERAAARILQDGFSMFSTPAGPSDFQAIVDKEIKAEFDRLQSTINREVAL